MTEISLDVLKQLEQAQADLEKGVEADGPPVSSKVVSLSDSQPAVGASGSGTAKHVLLDHYTTTSTRRLWAYVENAWRHRNVTNAEEEGLAQVAYTASRVDAWWDANNQITILRCWKTF